MLRLAKSSSERPKGICPSCGHKRKFVRYWNDETLEYFPDETVGACDRMHSCGYHKKPRESTTSISRPIHALRLVTPPRPKYDYFTREHLKSTLGNYSRNGLLQYLLGVFQDREADVWRVFHAYKVGTYCDSQGNYTCFPYIDRQDRFCRGKLIIYPATTGHKTGFDSLKKKLGIEHFNYSPIMFGEHLLNQDAAAPIAIVESEKSALVAAIHSEAFGDTIWIAAGGMTWLNADKILALGKRKVLLYPDAQQETRWENSAREANNRGGNVHVSPLLKKASEGTDLADVLIANQCHRNESKGVTDRRQISSGE